MSGWYMSVGGKCPGCNCPGGYMTGGKCQRGGGGGNMSRGLCPRSV